MATPGLGSLFVMHPKMPSLRLESLEMIGRNLKIGLTDLRTPLFGCRNHGSAVTQCSHTAQSDKVAAR